MHLTIHNTKATVLDRFWLVDHLFKKYHIDHFAMPTPHEQLLYFSDHKAQYQKFNASCSFFIHKVGAPDYNAH